MSQQQRLRILVADPSEASASEFKRILTDEGYSVEVVTELPRVPEEIREHGYQLVVLDVSPETPAGVEVMQRIREIDSDLCVIATTIFPSVESAVTTMKLNAFHYLQKPVDECELRTVVAEAIRTKGLLVDLEGRLNAIVGSRIRERRHSTKLTLKQLGNRTGLSVSLISQIELGKSAASMSTLHKLAVALDIRMTYFFETA